MNRHSQKGSALLIVLGFLSFMVVSAVAFAIWMRTERLPSSALRRSVANRYLVKAALAQAMSRVDDAIRSHPFPGAWNTNNQNNAYRDTRDCAYDWWESRVFMPPDPEGIGTTAGDPDSRYAPITKTVSVLNLEALGYLPPPLVNDVRLLSRASWAAQWEYFNFDAGRYAFCAVNVSDMLDINKIAADSPRTSAAAARPESSGKAPPPSRFSLAYLFRSGENGFANPSGHEAFDELTHTGLPDWPAAPLVSLLDYNLALEEQTAGFVYSPFYWFLSGRTKSGGFYGGSSGSPGVTSAERQPFVTDSWFPRSEHESSLNLYNIAQYQPFKPGRIKTFMEASDLGAVNDEFLQAMLRDGYEFSNYDLITLRDYLDEDDVPISLATPCAERVPMVTALGPATDLQVEFLDPVQAEPTAADGAPLDNEVWKVSDMKIRVTPPQVTPELVFPFMSGSGHDDVNYDVQTFMRLVFVDEGANTDPEKAAVTLRSDGFADLRLKQLGDWNAANKWNNDDSQFKFPDEGGEPNCMLVTSMDSKSWTPKNVMEPKDVYATGKGGYMGELFGSPAPREASVLRKIEVYEVTKTQANPTGAGTEKLKETRYRIVLRPFNVNGALSEISTAPMPEASFDALCAEHNIRPYLMVWVRVKDGNDTVDMVPATFADDNALNNVDNGPVAQIAPMAARAYGNASEQHGPILHFPSRMLFTYANAKNKTPPTDNKWVYNSCYTVDPRFNWAPENWWFAQEVPTLQNWYNHVFNDGGILDELASEEFGQVADNPRADRARDPILFVSNLGYLQSVGELAFLPRLSMMDMGKGNAQGSRGILDMAADDAEKQYNGKVRIRQNVKREIPSAGAAWKSYQSYRTNPQAFEFGANLYRRALVNPQQGFYVNPFTQSKEVMLAAFANTPLNYWVAGTNYTARGKSRLTKFERQDVFDADTTFRADYLAEYMMHRYDDLARMLRFQGGNMTGTRSYMMQKVWADMFDALDWGGRMNEGKTVMEIYEELADYYGGGGNASSYDNMYRKDNTYGELNALVTGSAVPGIELDTSRAVYGDERADPLYYYNGRTPPSKDPKSGDYICDADRMFLHSYWRDCFASRQQLFLIFVRAESTALGGNGEGTPAQQGGRAVALVWRDPEAPTGADIVENDGNDYRQDRHPHKMRILFYRQLD